MTLLQSMLTSAQTQRLGWALLHSLWEGAAVALALMLLLRFMRGRTANARYAVCCTAMLAAMALPILTFMSLRAPESASPPIFATHQEPAMPAVLATAIRAGDRPARSLMSEPAAIGATERPTVQPRTAPLPPSARPLRARLLDALHAAVPWLALAWACGVAVLSIWNLGGWVAIQRLKRRSTGPVDREIREMAERLRRRLGMNRVVRLASSARAATPMVIGALKPMILLPASVLCELSAAQIESILAHELAHVRRHDYLVNLIQSVAETLMFYHPAVRWIGRRIRIERENSCDDIAVSLTRDRVTYVSALSLVAARAPGLAPAAAGGVLVNRARRILGVPESTDVAGAPRWLSGALALAIVLALAGVLRTHEPAAHGAPAKPPQTQPNSIQVTLLDQETGQPVPGVSIRPYIHGDNDPRATTDANGKAELRLPPNTRSMNLWARKDGYVPTIARFSKGKDAIPPQFTMRIERGATIGGTVVDEHGNPIPGVEVFVQADLGSYDGSQRISTQVYDDKFITGAQGKWQCSIIPKTAKRVSVRLEHPDYASDARYGDSGKPSLDELLKRSDVLVLKKGFAVSGRILEVDGKPIKDAIVALGEHDRGVHAPVAHSDASGQFVLPHCQPDENAQMVVTAKGHSPAVEKFPLQADRNGLEVRLKPAKPLIVRIVNPQGQPLPNSRLFIQRWRNGNLINWDTRTDAHGRAVWNEAPDDTVDYCIYHEGYVELVQEPLVATGREQTVTLIPEVKVSGSVVDDTTNQPLLRFRVLRGWTSPGREAPVWERDGNSPAISGQDGKFELTEATDQDGYAIRIEADGYQPADSKVFHKEDGHPALAFRMKKAADISRTLVTPDGRPLAGADVLVVTGSSQIEVKDGSVNDAGTFTARTQADSAGRFRLPPQGSDFRLMIIHKDGCAELASGDAGGAGPIFVKPWARVEGAAWVGTKPAAGRTVIALLDRDNARESFRVRLSSESTVAADGSYRIDRIPPGTVDVCFIVPLGHSGTMSSYGYAERTPIHLAAGETAHVNLGGKGRPVIGRVVMPPSIAGQIDWAFSNCEISTRLHLPGRVLPPHWDQMDAKGKADWDQQWQHSPEVVRYGLELKGSRRYPFKLEPDGSFRVDDVQAGTYELQVQARDDSMPRQVIAAGTQEFTIDATPEGRSDQPLDLGSIGVVANHAPKLGENAPAFDVPGVDGKQIRLADLRGKYVLVDFWATWCGPCVAETPFLKSTWAAFGADPRFAMLSLSLDEKPDAPRQFAANQQIAWPQGFLGPWSQTEVPNEWGVEGIPSIFLIGPDGAILARNLRGDAIKAAVAQRLAGGPAPATAPATAPSPPRADAPRPPQPGTLSGTIVDPQGRPVAGAKVVLTRFEEALQREVPIEAVSDASGHFRLGRSRPSTGARMTWRSMRRDWGISTSPNTRIRSTPESIPSWDGFKSTKAASSRARYSIGTASRSTAPMSSMACGGS
jgi:beta-lactamase regulating signal transducer with metallopeptidase domain/peroxiredoxin